MDVMASLFGFFIVQLPVLVVLAVGLALLGRPERRLPGRSHTLARSGLLVLLAETVLALLHQLVFTHLILQLDWSATQFGVLSSIVSFMLSILFACGLALLVGAFATVRSESSRVAAAPPPAGPAADGITPAPLVGPDR